MMTLDSFFEISEMLTNECQFTAEQWEKIVYGAYQLDENFNAAVEHFWVDLVGFDYEECKDLVTDIQNGDGDAIGLFVDELTDHWKTE